MINTNSKYYISTATWNDGLVSATVLEIKEDGEKMLHITDDKDTINEYKSVAEMVDIKTMDDLWR